MKDRWVIAVRIALSVLAFTVGSTHGFAEPDRLLALVVVSRQSPAPIQRYTLEDDMHAQDPDPRGLFTGTDFGLSPSLYEALDQQFRRQVHAAMHTAVLWCSATLRRASRDYPSLARLMPDRLLYHARREW